MVLVIVVIASILLIALIVLWSAVGKKINKAKNVSSEQPISHTPVPPKEEPEEIMIKGTLWNKMQKEEHAEAARNHSEAQEKAADGVILLYIKPDGLAHKWQCGCCGAMNDDSEHTCVVCDHPGT